MLNSTECHTSAESRSVDGPGGPPSFCPLGPALKVLLVWPRFPSSFWTLDGVLDLVPVETDQPPLGLVTVGALCPKSWTLRLIDRSFEDLHDADILWADLVMVSGMRVQKDDIREILLRARSLGRRTMIGGPFASSEPVCSAKIRFMVQDHSYSMDFTFAKSRPGCLEVSIVP